MILALDDLDESKSSERIGWIYDTDYEFLNDESIVQVLATGMRCWDHQVRLLLAGGAPGEAGVQAGRAGGH